ncbi:hypothetical protein M9H77_23400 [Catharanthus roseus]|uniref:Uncharacterized protein n=1 Tax=Catharanthus roseus TaxID=4058 RepID=A0ACC0ASS9_CATRO|nr:hypothetical protein M9H77_23400 [Catharanthus roseus]
MYRLYLSFGLKYEREKFLFSPSSLYKYLVFHFEETNQEIFKTKGELSSNKNYFEDLLKVPRASRYSSKVPHLLLYHSCQSCFHGSERIYIVTPASFSLDLYPPKIFREFIELYVVLQYLDHIRVDLKVFTSTHGLAILDHVPEMDGWSFLTFFHLLDGDDDVVRRLESKSAARTSQ